MEKPKKPITTRVTFAPSVIMDLVTIENSSGREIYSVGGQNAGTYELGPGQTLIVESIEPRGRTTVRDQVENNRRRASVRLTTGDFADVLPGQDKEFYDKRMRVFHYANPC